MFLQLHLGIPGGLRAGPLEAGGELARGPQPGAEPGERALGDTVRLRCQGRPPSRVDLERIWVQWLQNEG